MHGLVIAYDLSDNSNLVNNEIIDCFEKIQIHREIIPDEEIEILKKPIIEKNKTKNYIDKEEKKQKVDLCLTGFKIRYQSAVKK